MIKTKIVLLFAVIALMTSCKDDDKPSPKITDVSYGVEVYTAAKTMAANSSDAVVLPVEIKPIFSIQEITKNEIEFIDTDACFSISNTGKISIKADHTLEIAAYKLEIKAVNNLNEEDFKMVELSFMVVSNFDENDLKVEYLEASYNLEIGTELSILAPTVAPTGILSTFKILSVTQGDVVFDNTATIDEAGVITFNSNKDLAIGAYLIKVEASFADFPNKKINIELTVNVTGELVAEGVFEYEKKPLYTDEDVELKTGLPIIALGDWKYVITGLEDPYRAELELTDLISIDEMTGEITIAADYSLTSTTHSDMGGEMTTTANHHKITVKATKDSEEIITEVYLNHKETVIMSLEYEGYDSMYGFEMEEGKTAVLSTPIITPNNLPNTKYLLTKFVQSDGYSDTPLSISDLGITIDEQTGELTIPTDQLDTEMTDKYGVIVKPRFIASITVKFDTDAAVGTTNSDYAFTWKQD